MQVLRVHRFTIWAVAPDQPAGLGLSFEKWAVPRFAGLMRLSL